MRDSGLSFLKTLGEDEGCLTLGGIEIGVTTGLSQTVGLTYDGTRYDLNREVQVAYEALHRSQLLGVLLSEVSTIGLYDVEEFTHHRADATEMNGAHGTAEQFGGLCGINERREVSGIHLCRLGIEDEVSPSLFHLLHISVQVARISLQVLVGTELDGIDEYGYHRTVVLTG